MDISETLQTIDKQAENLKIHRDIDVPRTIKDLLEIPEDNFKTFLKKVNSKEYSVIVFNQGDIYNIFNFIAPSSQKSIKSIIQYSPYIIAIVAAIFGVMTENYILIASLLIPFISGFMTGFINIGLIAVIILLGLTFFFFANDNIIGGTFMVVWTFSLTLTRYIRQYIQNVLLKLSLSHERIFAFLYYSRLLRIIDTRNQELIYSK